MCLQVIDGLQTYYAITKLGANELNPIVNYFMTKMGVGFGLIAVKMFVLILLAFLAILFRLDNPHLEQLHKSKFIAFCITFSTIFYLFLVGYMAYSIMLILQSP